MMSPSLQFLIACFVIVVVVSAVAGALLLRPRGFQEQRRRLPRDP